MAEALSRLWAIGSRNLRRNPRRTAITALALGGGLALSSVTWVLVDGVMDGTVAALVGGSTGHVQVVHPGQLAEKNPWDVVVGVDPASIEADPRVLGVTSRVDGAGLLATDGDAVGAVLVGLDAEREGGVTRLPEQVREGGWLAEPGQILLGEGLARRLEAQVGSEVTLLSQSADGSPAAAVYTVQGLLVTGQGEVDRSTAWLDTADALDLLTLDGPHRLMIRLDRGDDTAAVVRDLAARDGWTGVFADLEGEADDPTRTPVEAEAAVVARSWRAANPTIASTVDISKVWSLLSAGIVLITAGMGAMNTMLMSVLERTRELGILLAVGLAPRAVVAMVLAESLALSLLATAFGLPLGVIGGGYLAHVGLDLSSGYGDIQYAGVAVPPVLVGRMSVEAFLVPAVLLVVIAVAASLFPAIRAARLDPVDAMGRRS
ncbi:MAG: ABC transporter permease [Deltaproteobacteria bacterium]|nr:MAG: ABC transporter permease [Deltaproteobacteria bacterium]